MKKGFTLVELLAVIVILAIIAIIAVPIVLGIIEDTQDKANIRSAEMYIKTAMLAINDVNLNKEFNPSSCDVLSEAVEEYKPGDLYCDNTTYIKVEIDKPATGGTLILNNGKIAKIIGLKINNSIYDMFENENIRVRKTDGYITYYLAPTQLPRGYQPLEYIEATGTQYINTGYYPTVNTNIDTKCKLPSWINHNQTYCLFGSNNLYVSFYRWSGTHSSTFKKGINKQSVSIPAIISNGIVDYQISITGNSIQLINSKNVYTGTIDVDFTDTTSLPMLLWALNTDEGVNNKMGGRIYYFTIFEDTAVTANFIPALDTNGRPCMYDTVSKQTFYNLGTGEFNYDQNFNIDYEKISTNPLYEDQRNNIIPYAPEISGYSFVEWNTKADGSGISYNEGATISSSILVNGVIDLYAIYNPS